MTIPESLKSQFQSHVSRPQTIIIHGNPGIGKTSLASHFPKVVAVQALEDGFDVLVDSGMIKDVPRMNKATEWQALLKNINDLKPALGDDFKTLCLDALTGAWEMCIKHVTNTKFGGSEERYGHYGAGMRGTLAEWRKLLTLLDECRGLGVTILALCHTYPFKVLGMDGDDYTEWRPDIQEKAWGASHRWSDMVLYITYFSTVTFKEGDKGSKIHRSSERVLYTEMRNGIIAKNRMGLPPEISMGASSEEGFRNLAKAIQTCKARKK